MQNATLQNPIEFHRASRLENILRSRSLSDGEFEKISSLIYDRCRINLHDGKKELVQARLNKRLRQLGIESYRDYLKYVESDPEGREIVIMTDMLSTNLTYFFREQDHFEYLKEACLKHIDPLKTSNLRIWCAGCSSGEEAYSIAMTIREAVPEADRMDALILATDISTRMLATAMSGQYNAQRFKDTPDNIRDKYFDRISSGSETLWQARPELARIIRFRYLNLMSMWSMNGPFDVIFCRNVMIYFDKTTQADLVGRFTDILKPGGLFFVGHSESLTGLRNGLKYVRPSVYAKP